MRQERLNIGLIFRIGISLLPIIFGMPSVAMVLCAYNIAVSFILCGPLTSLVSALVSVCISMFFFGSFGEAAKVQGLFLSLEAILCAAACIYAIIVKRSFFFGVWLAALGFLLPSFMSLRYEATAAGVSVAQFLTDMPVALMKEQMQLVLTQSGAQLDFSVIEKLLDSMHSLIVAVIPSILVISSVMVGYVVMWLVCLHQRKLKGGVSSSFALIKIPRTMVFVLIASIVIAVLNINETITYVSMNVFLILAGICFFAGMSILDFYARGIIKNSVIRFIIHILIIMTSSTITAISPFINLFTIYALVAALDAFINLRKIGKEDYVKEELDEAKE